MPRVIAGMTMSLDGFVNDQHGSVGDLYSDFEALHNSEVLQEPIRITGAVVMGRRAFEMAADPDVYVDSYEFQTPIFVLTDTPPKRQPKQNNKLIFTFVRDGIASAIAQAKAAAAAAGDKDVTVVGGAHTIQTCLKPGLVDELWIDIMPVLLGDGLRLFEHLGDKIKLEKTKVLETPTRTSLRFRVVK